MSVTKSQLIATSASMYEHLPDETSLTVLGRQAALSPLTGTLALDVLKINSGPGATVMKALNGVGLDAVITANGMFKSPAFETERALKRLLSPSAVESLHRVQEILGSNQFAAQLAAVNSVRSVFTQDLARLADVSHTITSQFAVLCDSVASAALRSAALSGMRGWENAVTAFVERPDAREFFPLEALGRGTVGVGYAVALSGIGFLGKEGEKRSGKTSPSAKMKKTKDSSKAGERTCLARIDYRSGHNRCQRPLAI